MIDELKLDPSDNYDTRFAYAIERVNSVKLAKKTSLNLSGLGLKTIPMVVFDISNLEQLYLGKNQLVGIPDEISKLKDLKLLNIQRCKLIKISPGIMKLEKLRILNLSRNDINYIPESIENLSNLKTLTLTKNSISQIPSTIGGLQKLEALDLSFNNISSLPIEISKLQRLSKIILVGNPIDFPEERHIKGIHPSNNALIQVMKHFLIGVDTKQREIPDRITNNVEIPSNLKTAFQQYLLFFNDFVSRAKGINIDFNVTQIQSGLEISYPINSNSPSVEKYFDEYIGFIKQKVESINPVIDSEISDTEKEILQLELRNQVRHLTTQLEIKQFQNDFLLKQVTQSHSLLMAERLNPHPIHVSSSSNATSNSELNMSIDFGNELRQLQKDFLDLKNLISSELEQSQSSELETIDDQLINADENMDIHDEPKKMPFKRLRRIIDQINDPNSDWNKVVYATKKGAEFFKRISSQYNKIAKYLRLHDVPEILDNFQEII